LKQKFEGPSCRLKNSIPLNLGVSKTKVNQNKNFPIFNFQIWVYYVSGGRRKFYKEVKCTRFFLTRGRTRGGVRSHALNPNPDAEAERLVRLAGRGMVKNATPAGAVERVFGEK
jgi:hypothetical protein